MKHFLTCLLAFSCLGAYAQQVDADVFFRIEPMSISDSITYKLVSPQVIILYMDGGTDAYQLESAVIVNFTPASNPHGRIDAWLFLCQKTDTSLVAIASPGYDLPIVLGDRINYAFPGHGGDAIYEDSLYQSLRSSCRELGPLK